MCFNISRQTYSLSITPLISSCTALYYWVVRPTMDRPNRTGGCDGSVFVQMLRWPHLAVLIRHSHHADPCTWLALLPREQMPFQNTRGRVRKGEMYKEILAYQVHHIALLDRCLYMLTPTSMNMWCWDPDANCRRWHQDASVHGLCFFHWFFGSKIWEPRN